MAVRFVCLNPPCNGTAIVAKTPVHLTEPTDVLLVFLSCLIWLSSVFWEFVCDFLLLHNKFWGTVRYCVTCAPPWQIHSLWVPGQSLSSWDFAGHWLFQDPARSQPVSLSCLRMPEPPVFFLNRWESGWAQLRCHPVLAPRGKRCLRTRVAVQKPFREPQLGEPWQELVFFDLFLPAAASPVCWPGWTPVLCGQWGQQPAHTTYQHREQASSRDTWDQSFGNSIAFLWT